VEPGLARDAPLHHWYYYPAMHRSEVLVLMQHESQCYRPARCLVDME
jgi:hypothetical protein